MTRQRLSVEWIESDQCDWPLMVKRLASQIILQRAVVEQRHKEMVKANMSAPEKIELVDQVAVEYDRLAKLYQNLSKELAFQRSLPKP